MLLENYKMHYIFLILSAIVISISEVVTQNQCGDCVPFSNCPVANDLAQNKRDQETMDLFRKSYCGNVIINGVNVIKVCCSYFKPPVVVEDEIETHPNRQLLPDDCGQNTIDRIVGGTEARLYELPWMVLISHRTVDGLQFVCGGSLITERYVLTAAHCVHNKRIAGVRIGELDIDNHPDCEGMPRICESHLQDIRVQNSTVHEHYSGLPKVINDIALLRLKKPVNFTYRNARPICLPITKQHRDFDVNEKNATVAGWGFTESGESSSLLLKVTIPIRSTEACRGFYNRFARPGDRDATENQLCAGENNKDSCRGDSGGPLMIVHSSETASKYVQYGIVSHGPHKCGSNFPGVYTEVTKYVKWILDNIKP